jgi:hypothetical protein
MMMFCLLVFVLVVGYLFVFCGGWVFGSVLLLRVKQAFSFVAEEHSLFLERPMPTRLWPPQDKVHPAVNTIPFASRARKQRLLSHIISSWWPCNCLVFERYVVVGKREICKIGLV